MCYRKDSIAISSSHTLRNGISWNFTVMYQCDLISMNIARVEFLCIVGWASIMWLYRLGPVNSKSFVSHFFLRIKQIFELEILF